eukprot:9570234-Alexandrium_andersonii.AAC.1
MSASLVGSEMCIRDSLSSSRNREGWFCALCDWEAMSAWGVPAFLPGAALGNPAEFDAARQPGALH